MTLGLNGCSGSNEAANQNGQSTAIDSTAIAEASPISPPAPTPNFVEEEDGVYYYVGAVSEDERKQGKSTGDVIGFRYLGLNSDGHHRIANVGSDGAMLAYSSCAVPCKIIKYEHGGRTAFSPNSIIGGAYQDAMNGLLKQEKTDTTTASGDYPKTAATVPKPFTGAWDELTQDGCRNREARFYLTDKALYNFEVAWDVTKVVLLSRDDIDIHTTALGEDGNQVSEIWQFALADGGKALTGRTKDSPFFRRCPGT
ncbi:hypothetical protein [Sphingomonas sp. 35-24ZXX]|uniref:hypothetical protein n=1 Tax=Sphingomonas sp. 35-24ZXX TaxID=1545915 RepID=UPI0018CF75A9|nr:hypothetical protein [Sphingomonas sp. 35-24ZXX]